MKNMEKKMKLNAFNTCKLYTVNGTKASTIITLLQMGFVREILKATHKCCFQSVVFFFSPSFSLFRPEFCIKNFYALLILDICFVTPKCRGNYANN